MLLHISVIHFCSGFIWWTQSVKKQQFLSILINLSINFFQKTKYHCPQTDAKYHQKAEPYQERMFFGCVNHPALVMNGLLWFSGPNSKFRHIQGAVLHRDTHITNLRGLHLTTPGECDGFCANGRRVAVPLAIAGGQIAVFEVRHFSFLLNLWFIYSI